VSVADAPRRYFPVHVPHWMPGPQSRLGTAGVGDLRNELDGESAHYRSEKRRLVAAGVGGSRRIANADASAERTAAEALRAVLATEWPASAAGAAIASLDDVVAAIPEDVVLMQRDPGAAASSGLAVYVNVSFPTGWCPDCALGRDFLAIHAPVPEADRFGAGARVHLAANLFGAERRTTVRFVWTLTPDDALDRRHCAARVHPSAPGPSWDDAARAFLRVERQVVWPLDDALSIFLIRIYRYDVRTLTAEERATLRASVAAMDPRLRAYKGLAGHAQRIGALLGDA
jgi:hypothetical protein